MSGLCGGGPYSIHLTPRRPSAALKTGFYATLVFCELFVVGLVLVIDGTTTTIRKHATWLASW